MAIYSNKVLLNKTCQVLSNLQFGNLSLQTPDGYTCSFVGKLPGPKAHLEIRNWQALAMVAKRGDIGLGESYINQFWHTDDLTSLMTLFTLNADNLGNYAHANPLQRAGLWLYNNYFKRNSRKGSQDNIRAHYDVGNEFYQLWLDPTMTYSSGIFNQHEDTLETSQRNKYQRILNNIQNAENILEIGCGWGGFAQAASQNQQAITGITLSKAQHHYATNRLQQHKCAEVKLQDYRHTKGEFDSIVSIEMFEAVGEKYWPIYFQRLAQLLTKNGSAMIQTITIDDTIFNEYRKRSDFIRRYTFPGGMLPSKQKFIEQANRAHLAVEDIYDFGLDYAKTLRHWLNNFDHAKSDILALGYDQAFIRNWRFYLAMCIGGFEAKRTSVMQVKLRHA